MHAQLLYLCLILWDPMEPVRLLCPWDFSGKNILSGLPFPPPGDFPYPGLEPVSPALTGGFFTTSHLGNPITVVPNIH